MTPAAQSMLAAMLALFAISLWCARTQLAEARGIHKVVALTPLWFSVPLAAFGAEHFALAKSMVSMVPRYMPMRIFWIYFVGVALIAAAVSIATAVQVRWSGVLLGSMMFGFVAMIHLPGAIASGGRIPWTIVLRELSFGSGGLVLAGAVTRGKAQSNAMIAVGRVLIGIAAIFFGLEHFFHPLGLPGVPLVREMPVWIPARSAVDYITGALLVAAGVCFLASRKAALAAIYLGTWLVLLVVVIYGPVLIESLRTPGLAAQIEGLNYFADTLLFAAVILSVARSSQIPAYHA